MKQYLLKQLNYVNGIVDKYLTEKLSWLSRTGLKETNELTEFVVAFGMLFGLILFIVWSSFYKYLLTKLN